jgi:hypothetical protein
MRAATGSPNNKVLQDAARLWLAKERGDINAKQPPCLCILPCVEMEILQFQIVNRRRNCCLEVLQDLQACRVETMHAACGDIFQESSRGRDSRLCCRHRGRQHRTPTRMSRGPINDFSRLIPSPLEPGEMCWAPPYLCTRRTLDKVPAMS